jgi:uncharacterized DUF497 family protein
MKRFNWSPEKNQQLITERGVSFEDVIFYLIQGDILDDIAHPNPDKYSGQRIFVLNIDDYVHLVPYVESQEEIFLKTIIPSRKATKEYLGEKK